LNRSALDKEFPIITLAFKFFLCFSFGAVNQISSDFIPFFSAQSTTHFAQIELFPEPAIPVINVMLFKAIIFSSINLLSAKYLNPVLKILGLSYLAMAILDTYCCIVKGTTSLYLVICSLLNLFHSETLKDATVKKYTTLS
jgi:hypothetical protein